MSKKVWSVSIFLIVATVCILLLLKAVPMAIRETGDAGTQTVENMAKKIAQAIDALFHFTPRVTIDTTTIVGEKFPILELATVEQTIKHEYEWEHEWLHSTKKIRLTGFLKAKAGFDLNTYFQLDIHQNQGKYRINIYVPRPKLLSLELQPNFNVWSEDGWWNSVNDEERSSVVNAFLQEAKIQIAHGSLLETAMDNLEQQIDQIINAHIQNGDITYLHETPPQG